VYDGLPPVFRRDTTGDPLFIFIFILDCFDNTCGCPRTTG
jgi:hypothetical protein